MTADAIKKLRDKTNAGMVACKVALEESGGDVEKAVEILRKKGVAMASKKGGWLATGLTTPPPSPRATWA